MTKALFALLGLGSLVLLVACGEQPAMETPLAEIEQTAVAAAQTQAATLPTTIAGAVATPFAAATSLAITTTVTPTATLTPTATMTPTATPTPGTPTATPTLGPSASLIREAAALQDLVDAFREAVASGDNAAILQTQRELLEAIPEAEAVAAGDQSKAADAFRSGLRDLRAALNGDLAKLDSAAKGIAQISGGGGPTGRGTPTAIGQATAIPITSLTKFAKDMADKVAAFRKAQETGNVSDLLRLQQALLAAVDQGQAALKNAKSKDADTLRGALEDLANALGGDSVKYASAEAKLRQIGGATTGGDNSRPTAVVKTVDLQPVANELMNKLDAYQHAIDNKNKDEIAQAAKSLSDQIAKAQSAINGDQSAKAARLREALGPAREAAAGDQSKIDAAKSALEATAGSQ